MSSGNAAAFSHAQGMRGKPGKKKWSKHKKGATPLAKLKEQCLPEGWYSNIGTRISQLRRNLVQKCKQGMVRRKVKTACAMAGDPEECAKANKNIQKLVPMASTHINLDNQDTALLVSCSSTPHAAQRHHAGFPEGLTCMHAFPPAHAPPSPPWGSQTSPARTGAAAQGDGGGGGGGRHAHHR